MKCVEYMNVYILQTYPKVGSLSCDTKTRVGKRVSLSYLCLVLQQGSPLVVTLDTATKQQQQRILFKYESTAF